jgi:hypothetical protein
MMESIGAAVDGGLEVRVHIILGFPDETPEEIAETYAFMARLAARGVESLGVFSFCAYPGTELFDDLLRRGVIQLGDDYFDSLVFTDLRRVASFNPRFSALGLQAVALGGQAVFHGTQLCTHPSRALATLRQIARGAQGTNRAKAVDLMRSHARAFQELSRGMERAAPG